MVKAQRDAINAQQAADKAADANASNAAALQVTADEKKAVFDKKAAPTVERQAAVIKDAKPANANANIKVRSQQSPVAPDNALENKNEDEY